MATKICTPSIPDKKCDPVEVCLLSGILRIDEYGCASYESAGHLDGVVHSFSMRDGCVVALDYTAPTTTVKQAPCASLPDDCAGSGGGTSGSIIISKDPSNLSKLVNGELLTTLSYRGEGVSISGTGTLRDPLVVKLAPTSGGSVKIGGVPPIKVEGGTDPLTDPYRILFEPTGVYTGAAVGIVFKNGLAVDYEEEEDSGGVRAVVGGEGILVEQNGAVATVSLLIYDGVEGTYDFGGYRVEISNYGLVSSLTKRAPIAAAAREVIVPGAKMFFSEHGSLERVDRDAQVPQFNYGAIFTGGGDQTASFTLPLSGAVRIEAHGLTTDITETDFTSSGSVLFFSCENGHLSAIVNAPYPTVQVSLKLGSNNNVALFASLLA